MELSPICDVLYNTRFVDVYYGAKKIYLICAKRRQLLK